MGEREKNMALDMSAILDWMDHPLAMLDENLVMVWCNRAFCRLAGGRDSEPGAWIGRSVLEDGDPQRRGLLQRALRGESLHRFARMSLLPRGPVLDLEIRAGAVVPEGGKPYVVMSAEAADPAKNVLTTDAQIAAAGRLAAGIAHEFNNLHAGILGFLEQVMTRQDLDEELREDLETIHELARRASAITRNLMAFGLRRVSIMGAVSPDVLVASALDHMRPALETIGVSVQEDESGVLPGLYVDRDQIVQVLENLLQNAIDAMVGAGRKELHIAISQDEHFVTIAVEDSGRGIPEAHRGRVFEPFFTTKGSAASASGPDAALDGVGLGLSVCKSIVEQHGGKIEFTSDLDQGSRFVVSLPKLPTFGEEEENGTVGVPDTPNAAGPSEASKGTFASRDSARSNSSDLPKLSDTSRSSAPAQSSGPLSTKGSGRRLLVVDDEASVRLLVARTASTAGWDVTEADNALVALELLERERFDVVLLDLRMPEMDGAEMLARMERLPGDSRPAVVVCSGAPTDMPVDSSLVAGMLAKPFELQELLDRLEQALSR